MTLTAVPVRGRQAMARRADPFRDMEDVYDRMSQLMQDYFREGQMTTLADIEETDDGYIVEIDLPGVKRDDVSLEMRENELRVTGEIKERQRKGILRRRSRPVGSFEHVVVLPSDVDRDKVNAVLRDGVLTVNLGKSAASQPRRIEVKAS